MYWRHFNLSAEPFSLTPDPAFLYLSAIHAEAYAALTVGLKERRGLIAMIGEVGTGKTTLVYSLLSSLGPEIHTAYISNARLSFDGILRSALRDFEVECDSVHVSELLDAFNGFLHSCAREGTTAAIVIDEAQNLSRDTFEDLRLLTNFETYKHKLLQIVLVGQPELDVKLRDPALRQVADRIAVRCHVNPLTMQEARRYVHHRLAAAGGSSEIFSEGALRLLIRRSRGIPRSINILGHNSMLFAYGASKTRVARSDVREAVKEKEGRGLVRLQPRLPSWLRSSNTASGGDLWAMVSYPRLLIAGAVVGLLVFGIGVPLVSSLFGESANQVTATASVPEPARKADAVRPRRKHTVAVVAPPAAAPPAIEAEAVEPTPTPAAPAVVPEQPVVPDETLEEESVAAAPVERERLVVRPPAARRAAENRTAERGEAAAPSPQLARAEPARVDDAGGPLPEVSAPLPLRTEPLAAATSPLPPTRAVVVVPSGDGPAAAADPHTSAAEEIQTVDGVRVIRVRQGSSLYDLMTALYGSYDPKQVPRIQAMNPQMRNPDRIMAGDQLRFPERLEPNDE